ncbi:TPA: restriction endonuclease subunit S [Vibrio cholerae]|uniref:restriction endonuclease subunit S n=1 Tax=Vibrio cholerae TaxID=666 RepID=UPI00129AE733|nr:restriction endonuclease subunit S [Vibrio cholerae]MRI13496.1 restriction endonuclease subunit S [Vibrio cholerae]HEJ2449072.1 restriction endonuclease subunit S [Vibrio cholerae]HEJ2463802.1 restriction endonuclease subunit S [Vibrio cholerae]
MSWPLVKLGDVAKLINGDRGKNYPSKGSFVDKGIPFINAGCLSNEHTLIDAELNFITEEKFDSLRSGKIEKGDILFCLRGSLGKFALVDTNIKGAIASSLVIIRANEKVCIDYLKHYLGSFLCQREIQAYENGAAQPNLSATDLKSFQIPLPPLEVQKRIAAILDKADAIRQKRKQAIHLADEFLRSVFLDMFGDPVTNPKGWEVKACKDLFKRITVGIVVKPSSYYVESGVPALRSLNIGCYGIRSENLVYVSKSDNESILAKTRVYEGDLVIVRSGQPGKTAVVCKEFDGVNAIDILIATPKEELIEPQFFAFFMNSDGGKKIVLAEQRGQVQKHFNVGSLNSTAIPLPPLSLQRTFAEIAATVYGKYQTNKATEFNEIFNSISQKAFSGQL